MFYTPFFDLTWSFLIPNYHFSFVIYHLAKRIPPQSFIQFKLLFQKRIRIVWRINKKVLTLQMKYKDE